MPLFRSAENKDAPLIRRLWSRSFGDSEEDVQGFLEHFGIDIAVVSEDSGTVTGAAYIIPTDGIYLPNGVIKSCSYIYAVAVSPEFRGTGMGKELMKAALRFSKERGFEYSSLKPSDEGLFEFYRKLGFETFSYINELRLSKSELKQITLPCSIFSVTPSEYALIRENALKDIAHIRPSLKGIEFQKRLGKLYSITIGDITGCAAVEVYGNKCRIKELLVSENMISDAVSLIASKVPADTFRTLTPVYDESKSIPNGMIYPPLDIKTKNSFLGLAYD